MDAAPKAKRCGALAGVPIVVKDNIEVAGLPATGGTPALKGYVPKADAPVVKKLRDAGAIVLGKTNLHELAFGISGFNPAYNTGPEPGVRNAYDKSKSRGWFVLGHRCGAGCPHRLCGPGHGYGRLGTHPLRLQWLCEPQTHGGALCAGRHPADLAHARYGRPEAQSMADVELLDRIITGSRRPNPCR